MSAIAVSADGACIFLALEDTAGNQIIAKAARTNLSSWTACYDPNAGSAANVVPVPSNSDKMIFFGNFGTDIGLIKHTISTVTNTDLSPASLGSNVINTLEVNPSDEQEFVATVDTDQDVIHTTDDGTTYSTWDAALGFNATALDVLWSGDYFLHRYFAAGHNGTDVDLLYSPNEGSGSQNEENAALGAQANICSLEVTEA